MQLMESRHLFDNYQTRQSLRTATKLTEMFTENTGTHGLDSGGAYGRNWQRNMGLTLDDFFTGNSATWEKDFGVTLNAWRYCFERLSYTRRAEILTRLMHVWELADYDNRNPWNTLEQEDFIKSLGGENLQGFNTYNWDNCLSQVLQGYDFTLGGENFVLLQVHGGADVRGGYTRPVFFEPECEYWIHGIDSYSLNCTKCETYFGVRGPDVWDPDGVYVDNPLTGGCPKCGADFTATMDECC